MLLAVAACRDNTRDRAPSSEESLPPVISRGPATDTNWDEGAGPMMLVSLGNGADSAAIVFPEVTDTTIRAFQGSAPAVSGVVFDLLGRGGSFDASTVTPLAVRAGANRECNAWPAARVQSPHQGWRVGLVRGNVQAIALDSIEALPSTDSAVLAASLAQSAAGLSVSSDPTFRRLPFRVRSAYTFRFDSVDMVAADIVRALNEEANPRIEHLLLIGERPAGKTGKYAVGYYSRIAGSEETMQATEILAAVEIMASKRPAIIVNVESEEGSRLGLIERMEPVQWRSTWKSAYTNC